MEVRHQHGGRFHVKNTFAAGFYLLQSSRVDGNRFFCRSPNGPRLSPAASLPVAMKGNTAILCMNGAVMTE